MSPEPTLAGLPDRVRLVVIFGGRSAEHDVSCVSAASVLAAVDPERYDVVPIGIAADGTWVQADSARAALAQGPGALPSTLTIDGPRLEPMPSLRARTDDDVPVVVFAMLHGPYGEDGTVQGLIELAGVPYIGAGVLGSALAMDKAKAKEVLAQSGLPQARWLARRDRHIERDELSTEVAETLGWPVFVKPANLGSSVGISKVNDASELTAALDLALGFDEWVVIEEAVTGRELECGVLDGDPPSTSVVGEIVPSAEFYDYDDKYSGHGAQLVIPAEVPEAVAAEVQALARAAFDALRAEGMARVDFFYEAEGRGLLVNELNTIPGFTPHSMYPRLWEASGVPYSALVDRLVALALARHQRRSQRAGHSR